MEIEGSYMANHLLLSKKIVRIDFQRIIEKNVQHPKKSRRPERALTKSLFLAGGIFILYLHQLQLKCLPAHVLLPGSSDPDKRPVEPGFGKL